MIAQLLKSLLPKRPMLMPILFGPFRGARILMPPYDSLRKMFGLYEHELNAWLEAVLPRVETVLDVSGNNGYFTFGCAAAFRRLKKAARIFTYEPSTGHCETLRATAARCRPDARVQIAIHPSFVGREAGAGTETLNALAAGSKELLARPALIKIDVEGAEIDVIEGASAWLTPDNYSLIEVHQADYLDALQACFAVAGLRLEQRNQRPLPVLGWEHRPVGNWWLVSPLAA